MNMNYSGFQQQQNFIQQPVFKQYAVGSGIDNTEYNNITKACSQAYINKSNPLSTNAAATIKQYLGGEWFVCCSPLNNKNFDFCISSVSGGDFLSFSLDNVLFEVCRLKNIFTESIIDEEKAKQNGGGSVSQGNNQNNGGNNNGGEGKAESSNNINVDLCNVVEVNVGKSTGMSSSVSSTTSKNSKASSNSITMSNSGNVNVNSNYSPVKNRKTKQLENLLSQRIINIADLKTIAWKGIPFDNINLRAEVWKYLLGYYPSNTDLKDNTIKRKRQEYLDTCMIYDSLLENPTKNMNDSEMKIYKQISVDVPRTMPEYRLFSYDIIRKMMLRVLYVWSMRHPASGYVQGFNDLCTPFFLIFITQHMTNMDIESTLDIDEDSLFNLGEEILHEIEADTYWCFTKMMDRIQNNYTHNQPGLTLMISKMEAIIKFVDEDLLNHLTTFDITFMQFSFRWMNCYLMREFSIKLIIRLWDTYFSEEDAFNTFHLYVCAGLLLNFSEKIKKMSEFQETMMFLQNLPMSNWTLEEIDVLLAKAFQIHSMYGKLVDKACTNTNSINK